MAARVAVTIVKEEKREKEFWTKTKILFLIPSVMLLLPISCPCPKNTKSHLDIVNNDSSTTDRIEKHRTKFSFPQYLTTKILFLFRHHWSGGGRPRGQDGPDAAPLPGAHPQQVQPLRLRLLRLRAHEPAHRHRGNIRHPPVPGQPVP